MKGCEYDLMSYTSRCQPATSLHLDLTMLAARAAARSTGHAQVHPRRTQHVGRGHRQAVRCVATAADAPDSHATDIRQGSRKGRI